ncbi:MAG: sulfotransferase family protein [Steroidobacteraceae bacterium]|nr:sulfotransferase family protein [Steroidobacteraceae bacterium]
MFRSIFGGFTDLTRGKRIVFLAINKTGSSSLWTWMDEHQVPYLMNRYREDEATKLRIIAEVRRKHLPCFTVVRNPWSRAVSSWKWCMQEKGLAPCSFEEFLRIPLERMTEQQRFHTLPQWRHVADEQGHIDYLAHLGRLEDLGATRDWLADTLGLPRPGELPHLKKSSSADWRQHYTPTTRALVADTFGKDFELFGYDVGTGP